MLPEEIKTFESRHFKDKIIEKNQTSLETEENKQYFNEKTKKIHNNLRYFLPTVEQEFLDLKQIKTENDNLLSSLVMMTNGSKPFITSTNFIKPECFVNENFKRDLFLNDSYDSKENYAKIFTDDDYSEIEEAHKH